MDATRDQNGRKRASKWDTPAPSTGSATEAAREAARKLNAMLAAKGKLTTNAPAPLLPPKPKSTTGTTSAGKPTSMFTEEVEINDSPKRLLLCQGNVQYEINKYSGAAISTKGQYIAPSEKGNMIGQKPLYLTVQSTSRDKINLAVQRIRGIMNGDDPFAPPPVPPQHVLQSGQSSALPSGMYYVQEKVFVGLDNVQPEFNLKEKILGPGESYFHHINKETGAKVHLRGRGSGYIEATSGREAFEALYVYVSHTNYPGLNAAKKLVENLIQTVHTAYQQFQVQQTSNSYHQNYGGYPGHNTTARQPPNMYNMPPVSGYGPPHHPNGPPPPSYPSYPYMPPNQPPPHYNQPRPNHNIPPNPQMPPPHAMYPHPASRHEAPRPLMEQHPTRPPMQHSCTPYTPESPTKPHPSPPSSQLSYDTAPAPDQRSSKHQETSSKDDEKPAEEPKTAKRRFTEAPAKKTIPPKVPESVSVEKRSVLSLDQQSESHTPGGDGTEKRTSGNMAPPLLPAPKVKPSDGSTKKNNISSPDGFKLPVMPMSALLTGVKKNLPAPPEAKTTAKKRKVDESVEKKSDSERKSSGIALLASYDGSSDED